MTSTPAGQQHANTPPASAPVPPVPPTSEAQPEYPTQQFAQPTADTAQQEWATAPPPSPWAYVPPQAGPEQAPPTGGPGGPGRSRGPGWLGVGAAAIAAAVLASAATAGVVVALDDDSSRSTQSLSSSRRNVEAPVTSSSASSPNWQDVASAVEPSVVQVQVQDGEGSGAILDKQGHIVTNSHVVASGGQIGVVLQDGRAFTAKTVGDDPTTDLAVIKIDNPPADLRPIVVGDSDTVKVGDPTMAVGNPLGLTGTVTTGIVSAVDRPVTTQLPQRQQRQQLDPFGLFGDPEQPSSSEPVVTNAIQTDAAINPGNSGGPLVDAQGRLIGIISSIYTLGGGLGGGSGSIGLGFAIPGNQVRNISDELIKSGKADHPWLGVTLEEKAVSVDGARRMAAVIAKIEDNSPADKAGMKLGDGIIAVDGETVNGSSSLVAQLRERRPGDSVTLSVVRDGKAQDMTIELEPRPKSLG
jgi:putative serine protease PepD